MGEESNGGRTGFAKGGRAGRGGRDRGSGKSPGGNRGSNAGKSSGGGSSRSGGGGKSRGDNRQQRQPAARSDSGKPDRRRAPPSSPRPVVNPSKSDGASPALGYAGMTPEQRAVERAMVEQFGNLELRADLDRFLKNDALARLGYDPENVQWFDVRNRVSPFYTSMGVNLGDLGVSRTTALGYNDMYPGTRLEVPPDTIVMNSSRGLPTLAHEARHRGFEVLQGLGSLPAYPENMTYFDSEQFTEIGDQPFLDEVYNLPRTATRPSGATTAPFGETIDRPAASPATVEYYNQVQDAALQALRQTGEPPQAVMREPQPGSAFYEPRGGLGGLFDRVRGIFD